MVKKIHMLANPAAASSSVPIWPTTALSIVQISVLDATTTVCGHAPLIISITARNGVTSP
eukprot:CAMPEP_0203782776 /NCGR_PEP_ID=MMETSP0099_2-20121227/11283_1 /ASSEMBLY_ACC=CAM_ASM_000209 /TAXON_ID=96639 /ORGANISM=" , Strain NY0313808BC1" /LENGTH=59 /DNA_ID=CAMNT_0050684519 /DNA_START=42 /DNA_END=221 /DNA_ORIENTATION=-